IVLERFEDYWGKKPPVRRIIVIPVSSAQTALEKLAKGEVHIVDHPPPAELQPLQDDPRTHVDLQEGLNTGYLGFNVNRFPYSDVNFRRAVSLALDRDLLIKHAFTGLAEPAANIVPPPIWGDTAPTPPYEHDLEKAKECLAKVTMKSNEVDLVHMTFARPYFPEPHRVAEFVKDQLRKIGLDVKLRGFEKSAYDSLLDGDDYGMYLLGWSADYPDPDNFFYFLLHGDSSGDLNHSFWNDPAFNAPVTQAQSEIDPAKRKELYRKAYDRYRDQLPSIPLVHTKFFRALSKDVAYKSHPLDVRYHDARFRE
ncbi:MAG: ABC transporter substrate-binding protein, partial [Planctomycetota bacterium]